MAQKDTSSLKRDIHTMPKYIRDLLTETGLMNAYKSRPPYQRNDYLGWIDLAVRAETKQKRLEQMIAELRLGNVYMNMKWAPLKKQG